MLSELANFVDIKIMDRSNGAIAVYTSGGLSLVDNMAATITYDQATNQLEVNGVNGLNDNGGRLAALSNLRNQATDTPPGFINQLRSQLDQFVLSLTATGTVPASFTDAYNSAASTALTGTLASNFFVGNDRFSFNINPDLLGSDPLTINTEAVDGVVAALVNSQRSFNAGGLVVNGQDYTGLVASISALVAQNAGNATQSNEMAAVSLGQANIRFSSAVGVNMDEELAGLQMLQTSYAANAHVMTVIDGLYQQLFSMVD